MGAIPAGFRPSTLFQLLEEGNRCLPATTDLLLRFESNFLVSAKNKLLKKVVNLTSHWCSSFPHLHGSGGSTLIRSQASLSPCVLGSSLFPLFQKHDSIVSLSYIFAAPRPSLISGTGSLVPPPLSQPLQPCPFLCFSSQQDFSSYLPSPFLFS